MPLSAREFTDITALLKLILNGYPGNAAILREYLQNSDDAIATLQVCLRVLLNPSHFSLPYSAFCFGRENILKPQSRRSCPQRHPGTCTDRNKRWPCQRGGLVSTEENQFVQQTG